MLAQRGFDLDYTNGWWTPSALSLAMEFGDYQILIFAAHFHAERRCKLYQKPEETLTRKKHGEKSTPCQKRDRHRRTDYPNSGRNSHSTRRERQGGGDRSHQPYSVLRHDRFPKISIDRCAKQNSPGSIKIQFPSSHGFRSIVWRNLRAIGVCAIKIKACNGRSSAVRFPPTFIIQF